MNANCCADLNSQFCLLQWGILGQDSSVSAGLITWRGLVRQIKHWLGQSAALSDILTHRKQSRIISVLPTLEMWLDIVWQGNLRFLSACALSVNTLLLPQCCKSTSHFSVSCSDTCGCKLNKSNMVCGYGAHLPVLANQHSAKSHWGIPLSPAGFSGSL